MSTRDISNDNITALNAKLVRPIAFVRMDFDSGVKRFHTEIGPRTAVHPVYGSEVYTGIGDFGGLTTDITESTSSAAQVVKFGLSGVNPTLIADVMASDDYHRREIELMFGFDDENGDLIDDPVIVFGGYMDKADIIFGEGKADISLSCESRASILQGNSDLRFTDEQMQTDYSGDLAGEYIYRMLDIVLKIGGAKGNTASRPGSRFAASK